MSKWDLTQEILTDSELYALDDDVNSLRDLMRQFPDVSRYILFKRLVAQAAQDKLRAYQAQQTPEQVREELADAICSDCLDVIREIICPKLNDATDDYCPRVKNILAIIQPLIEAASKEERDRRV